MSSFFDLLSLQFIAGPQFLFVYAGLIVASCISVVTQIGALKRRRILDIPRRDLSPYELAFLRGGGRRALSTAVVHLETQGGLEVHSHLRPATIKATSRCQTENRLEKAVLAAATPETTLPQMLKSNSILERLSELQADLEERNWLVPPGRVQSVRNHAMGLAILLSSIGLTRLWIGLVNSRPILYLLAEWFAMLLTFRWFFKNIPLRPKEAEEALAATLRGNSALGLTARSNPGTLRTEDKAMALALFGLGPMAASLMPASPIFYTYGSDSGSSYSSCSSSSSSSCSSSSSSCSSSSTSSCSSSSSCSSGSSCGSSCSSSSSCGG